MYAIQIKQNGTADVLEYVELPAPVPGPGQVLVAIESSGVNFIDVYYREGRYPAPLPLVLGQEAAGTVAALGPDVTNFQIGDRVAWRGGAGAYAQMAVAPAAQLVRVPDNVTSEQAAAVLVQGLTAHYLSESTYPIRSGETVLIHAGAGGTGLLLTQLAKKRGARVITTVSTEEKAALSRAAGADEVILYTQQDFAVEVKRITHGEGLPVVYDSVGKTTFEQSLQCLKPRGMLVLFGGASGAVPPFDLIRLSTMGALFVTRPTLGPYVATRAELEARANDVFAWVAEGSLKLHIEPIYPLKDAAQAQRDLESRKTTGKLLLRP
jgi:NADPH2:quinone reductase